MRDRQRPWEEQKEKPKKAGHRHKPWPGYNIADARKISTTTMSAPLHVVCNVPLVAPVPLPYHSPTFLHFDLPDIGDDLSKPPYTSQAPRRKRAPDEQLDTIPAKRPFTCTRPTPPCRRLMRHAHLRPLQRP